MRKEFKFPTIIGLIVLIISIIIGMYLTRSPVILGSKASGTCNPDSLQITNITNNSASISFITASACSPSISINNKLVTEVKNNDLIHYFEIKNLSATTDYVFSVVVSGQTISKNEYKFKTASSPNSVIPTSNLAWGKVYNPDGKTVADAIVYLNIPGASPLSSFVTTDGNWSVSLANSFNESKSDWFLTPTSPLDEDIIVVATDGSRTQVVNSTALNNPVPDIIIGKNSLDKTTLPSPPASGQIIEPTQVAADIKVDIFNPKDGESLTADQPDFFGSAPNNSTVVIEVHSDVIVNGQVSADNSGSWHWSPPTGLTPGNHTITVKVQNPVTGIWESVTRNFIVLASDGNSPKFEASASATTPTLVPSPIPTETPLPTARAAKPSVAVKPPVTGDTAPTIIIMVSALIFFLISVKFIK